MSAIVIAMRRSFQRAGKLNKKAIHLQGFFFRVSGCQGLDQDRERHPDLLEEVAGAGDGAEGHPHVSGAAVAAVMHDNWPFCGQRQLRPTLIPGQPNLHRI